MPRRVVTLPPTVRGDSALAFAARARARGAELLEVRTDLHDEDALSIEPLARVVPLLIAERGRPVPGSWAAQAALRDRDLRGRVVGDGYSVRDLCSHHAEAPMSPAGAEALWAATAVGEAAVKHVEPLGSLAQGERLFETRQRLATRFGAARVTVLATGPLALPWRARLAADNALDYLSAEPGWSAAPGQRLLEDAVRAARARAGAPRLGILGSDLAESRSPRIHPAPFDRIELPPDTDLAPLLAALAPHYRGLAVTNPFKRAAARAVAAEGAVNTLVRAGDGWLGHNTDVAGARLLLRTLAAAEVCVLGDGGVTDALREAAAASVRLVVMRHAEGGQQVRAPAVWTWPASIAPPAALAFAGGPVAIIAYGRAARAIGDEIRRRGGVPLAFGPRWLVAQARGQRAAWGLP